MLTSAALVVPICNSLPHPAKQDLFVPGATQLLAEYSCAESPRERNSICKVNKMG